MFLKALLHPNCLHIYAVRCYIHCCKSTLSGIHFHGELGETFHRCYREGGVLTASIPHITFLCPQVGMSISSVHIKHVIWLSWQWLRLNDIQLSACSLLSLWWKGLQNKILSIYNHLIKGFMGIYEVLL